MNLTLVTPAAWSPVTIQEVCENSRIDHGEEDSLIQGMIVGAVAHVERLTGRVIGAQTWEAVADGFPAGDLTFDLGPIVSVTSVTYLDADGNTQTIDAADYRVDTVSASGRISPVGGWPTAGEYPNAVRVRFVAGVNAADADVRQAILLMVGHWYEHREDASSESLQSIPLGSAALLGLHRRMFV